MTLDNSFLNITQKVCGIKGKYELDLLKDTIK